MKVRRLINKSLRPFGYELQKTTHSLSDAYAMQRRILPLKQGVIFDVGAHVGSIAAVYRALFPQAVIHCFEPFPASYQKLLKNTAHDGLVEKHQVALSSQTGKAFLNANASSSTNSLLASDERAEHYWGSGVVDTTSRTEVLTTTLDEFASAHQIGHIDILKLDVQGAEFDVLQGAQETLKSQRVSLIYLELILCPTYQDQRTIAEYMNFLSSLGYEFLDFFNPVRRHQQLIQADAIFVSADFKRQSPLFSKHSLEQRRAA